MWQKDPVSYTVSPLTNVIGFAFLGVNGSEVKVKPDDSQVQNAP